MVRAVAPREGERGVFQELNTTDGYDLEGEQVNHLGGTRQEKSTQMGHMRPW